MHIHKTPSYGRFQEAMEGGSDGILVPVEPTPYHAMQKPTILDVATGALAIVMQLNPMLSTRNGPSRRPQ